MLTTGKFHDWKVSREGGVSMDWVQVLTIVATILGGIYIFYTLIKQDISRHEDELKDMRKEFSKRDFLWAELLKEIYAIKLFQSKKDL